jgi:hypothetical protein
MRSSRARSLGKRRGVESGHHHVLEIAGSPARYRQLLTFPRERGSCAAGHATREVFLWSHDGVQRCEAIPHGGCSLLIERPARHLGDPARPTRAADTRDLSQCLAPLHDPSREVLA